MCQPIREYAGPGTGSGVLVDDAELLVVEEPGTGPEEPSDHLDQGRVVDEPVGGVRGAGGEDDVVGEGTPVDDGIRRIQDVGAVAGVERPGRQSFLGIDQLGLRLGQVGRVEGTSQGGVAVDLEERLEHLELVGPEHPWSGRAHRGTGRRWIGWRMTIPRLYARPAFGHGGRVDRGGALIDCKTRGVPLGCQVIAGLPRGKFGGVQAHRISVREGWPDGSHRHDTSGET